MRHWSLVSAPCVVVSLYLAAPAAPLGAQNSVPCVKPWAIADRWVENQTGTWDIDDSFDRYVTNGPGAGQVIGNPDVYLPPDANSPGTGFQLPLDYGTRVRVKAGDASLAVSGGWFLAIDVNGAGSGGDAYRKAISTCIGSTVAVGDVVTPLNGNLHGPTVQGVADLMQLDPAAVWDPGANAVVGSAHIPASLSPRIVPVVVFDPDVYQSTAATGTPQVRVVNILGIFIEGLESRNVIGRIVTLPQINP